MSRTKIDVSLINIVTSILNMGSNKITNLANGTVSTDAAAFGQLPGQAGTITNWVQYTSPTVLGATGTNSSSIWYQRIGKTMTIQGWFHSTAFGAANLALTLPASLTVDTSQIGTTANAEYVGQGILISNVSGTPAGPNLIYFFFDGSDTSNIYWGNGTAIGTPNPLQKRAGSSFFGASNPTTVYMYMTVPIAAWSI